MQGRPSLDMYVWLRVSTPPSCIEVESCFAAHMRRPWIILCGPRRCDLLPAQLDRIMPQLAHTQAVSSSCGCGVSNKHADSGNTERKISQSASHVRVRLPARLGIRTHHLQMMQPISSSKRFGLLCERACFLVS